MAEPRRLEQERQIEIVPKFRSSTRRPLDFEEATRFAKVETPIGFLRAQRIYEHLRPAFLRQEEREERRARRVADIHDLVRGKVADIYDPEPSIRSDQRGLERWFRTIRMPYNSWQVLIVTHALYQRALHAPRAVAST